MSSYEAEFINNSQQIIAQNPLIGIEKDYNIPTSNYNQENIMQVFKTSDEFY